MHVSIPSELAERLRSARSVAVLTGAGVSAESGIPTFRDAQKGLWATFNPQDLATPAAFVRNPRLVWEWYAERRVTIEQTRPNPGHVALAELERRVPDFTLITQNIDGLHSLAGSQRVIELHGNIRCYRCFDENVLVADWPATDAVPPLCPNCGGLLRPDVVWFGELLDSELLSAAREAAQRCDLFLSVGTSAQVEPAASLPQIALNHGAVVVIVNPEVSESLRSPLYRLSGPSGVVLPALVRAAWPEVG